MSAMEEEPKKAVHVKWKGKTIGELGPVSDPKSRPSAPQAVVAFLRVFTFRRGQPWPSFMSLNLFRGR